MMLLSACREYAPSAILYKNLQKVASSSPGVSKVTIDIDKDGVNDLLLDAFNNDLAVIGSYDNGIFVSDISTTYDFEFIYNLKIHSPFLGQSYVMSGVTANVMIDGNTIIDGSSWQPLELEGELKYLLWYYGSPLLGAWFHHIMGSGPVDYDTFLPFRAKRSGSGSFYYGWIRLKDGRVAGSIQQKIRIVDIAFNAAPNEGILAGQKK